MTREEAIKLLVNATYSDEWQGNEDLTTAYNMAIKALEQEPCEDCISREQAKLAIRDRFKDLPSRVEINTILNELPSVTHIHKDRTVQDFADKCRGCGKHKWIPFTTRPLTEEEKEEHSEWDGILDCKLPDDGQRILVSISVRGHECVQYDEFYMDDGCYLDSGYEIGTEAVAWKPLPEPYNTETEKQVCRDLPEPKPEDFMTEEKQMKVVLGDGAYVPEKAHRADAGYDLKTPKRVVLRRHDRICIDTGVHMQIPDGWYGQLFSKSGLNVKHDIVSLGGTVDSGFTGNIVVKLYNLGEEDHVFEAGDKIVQIVFMPCGNFCMTQVDELEGTERGDNGFGSTGK